jgi:hypothetical protein
MTVRQVGHLLAYSHLTPSTSSHQRTCNYCSSFGPQHGFSKGNSTDRPIKFFWSKSTLWANDNRVMRSSYLDPAWFCKRNLSA